MRRFRAGSPVAVGLLVVIVLTAGCSSSGDRGSTPSVPAPSTSTPGPVGASVDPDQPLERAPLSRYFTTGPTVTGYSNLGPPAIDGALAVAPAGTVVDGGLDRVVILDSNTGRSRVVAHTGYPHGFINFVAITDRWVLWVDQSGEQGDFVTDVTWKILALDLDTHQRRVLGSSGARPNPYVPRINATDGYAYWATAEPDRTARQWLWKVGSPHPETVLRHAQIDPTRETLDDGRLYYVGASQPDPAPKLRARSDCWSVPITGGTQTKITATSLALNCQAGHGWLVYELHADPEDPPPGELVDNPYEVWAQEIGGGEPVLLHRGYVGSRWPRIGDGFALWDSGHGLAYSPLGQQGPSVALAHTQHIYERDVSGDRVAYIKYNAEVSEHAHTFGILVHKSATGHQPSAPNTTTRVTPTSPHQTCRPQDRTENGSCAAPASP